VNVVLDVAVIATPDALNDESLHPEALIFSEVRNPCGALVVTVTVEAERETDETMFVAVVHPLKQRVAFMG
jgi:hypothetical protein